MEEPNKRINRLSSAHHHNLHLQPGMVDVYAHALQYDDSPLVVKRVLVAATNVHRVVLRCVCVSSSSCPPVIHTHPSTHTPFPPLPTTHSYAAHSGLAQIWADYCRRVKAPVLAMRDDPVRMADPGIAQVRV